jgi:lectin, mannose-binding 2
MFSRSLLLFVTAAALSLVSSTKLTLHSFEPPFKDVDGAGDRMINKYWRSSGHTVVHSNFIRLTPDRQSKRGAIWSTKPLGVDSWSGLLSFRISGNPHDFLQPHFSTGQGKTLFGDGIALWITHSAFHNAGELHGSQEKFVGVGIIFDTFRNSENSAVHRDITILVNDGTQTYESMAKASVGCDSNFRFHADRADFSVSNAARAKILVEEGR